MREKHFCQFRMFVTFLLLNCIGIGSYAESVTYVQTSKSETVALSNPDGAKVVYKNTYNGNYNTQISGGNSMTYAFSGFDGCTIIGVTLKMRSNQSSGGGSLDIKVGDTPIAKIDNAKFNAAGWYGAWSSTYVDIKPDVTATKVGADEPFIIVISATESSLYCQSVTIEYELASNKVKAPLLPTSCTFMEDSKTIAITNNTDGAIIYYTTDGSEPSADNGTKYESPFTITETTTVKAIAVKEGESSDIVEATYTKIVDYYRVSFSINGAIDADDDILIPYDDNLTENSLPTVEHPGNIKMKGWAREANLTDIVTFPITNIKEDLIL